MIVNRESEWCLLKSLNKVPAFKYGKEYIADYLDLKQKQWLSLFYLVINNFSLNNRLKKCFPLVTLSSIILDTTQSVSQVITFFPRKLWESQK